MSKNRNPESCEQSVNHTGTYICKLSTLPCSLYQSKECELDAQDRAMDALAKFFGDIEKVTE